MNATEKNLIYTYFEQKFSFNRSDNWNLPCKDSVCQEPLWSIENMKQLKSELNISKSLLNDKGDHWHQHTSNINKAGYVIEYIKSITRPEILTQAWCKFYEVLSNYRIIPLNFESFTSVHLCEAPGAFISSLNYYLCLHNPEISWKWIANTLNPYYEGHDIKSVIVDDRLIFPTLRNWYFSEEDTGDLIDSVYIKEFLSFLENRGPISLITADGSVNCLEAPDEQELITSHLQFNEMLIALQSLCIGGNFILKQFTFFECITICKMYFLNCVFREVHVFKPFTSKRGNSEVYVICLDYLGSEFCKNHLLTFFENCESIHNKALFPLSSIPETFLSQITNCSKYFSTLQKQAIEENLMLYSCDPSDFAENLDSIKHQCADYYLKKCHLLPNEQYDSVRLFSEKRQIKTSFYNKQNRNCKSMYFQAVGETFDNLSKSKSMLWYENVLDVDKRLNACFPASFKNMRKEIKWQVVWKDILNRMKSKNYRNWIALGKKVTNIKNSKFCNPMLIHLWNKISYCPEVKWVNHVAKDDCFYDLDTISLYLEIEYKNYNLISVLESNDCHENDPLWSNFKAKFSKYYIHYLHDTEEEIYSLQNNKAIYINTTYWIESFHQETIIKNKLMVILSNMIKVMDTGDCLILCIQTVLMRFTVGIIYILLSLFEKFCCVLPNEMAPANCGQLWIFKNFLKPNWTHRVVDYFKELSSFNVCKSKEILQIVPITALCGGSFYEFLLNINNDHMSQRLRSITLFEKCRT